MLYLLIHGLVLFHLLIGILIQLALILSNLTALADSII